MSPLNMDRPTAEPAENCPLCPRLVAFRNENKAAHPDWFNGAVPSFGDDTAELLIVGLAPGMQGANKTGRPFTGDYAGDLLYETMAEHGFSKGSYGAHPDDGLVLVNAMITNAVRCVPPQNKPIGAEATACRPFLTARLAAMPNLKAVLCLGKIAHDNVLKALGLRLAAHPFAHAAMHRPANIEFTIYDSYHCSRYNTNTGRLTSEMFSHVFSLIRRDLGE